MVIPYDPCGKIVDWYHKPYTTWVRPYRNSDLQAKIEWYPARDDAPALPFESAFCNLDQMRRDQVLPIYAGYKVGEVPFTPRVRNFLKPLSRPTGDHVCGSEADFRDGAIWTPDVQPLVRDADGLPVCCRAGGGIFWGGRSGLSTPGGIKWSGNLTYIIPNPSCSEAPNIDLGVNYYHLSGNPAGEGLGWYKTDPLPGGNYRVTATGNLLDPPDPNEFFVWDRPTDCSAFGSGFTALWPNVDMVVPITAGNSLHLEMNVFSDPFSGIFDAQRIYNFRVDPA